MTKKDFKEYIIMLAKKIHISNDNKKKSNLADDEKEEQPKYYSVKDEDIDIRNKSYEDNYINNK